MTSSQPKPQLSLSDREKKLRMLVDNNLIEEATMYLEEHELPFLILPQPDGKHLVRSIYTEGEQYLNRFITITKIAVTLSKKTSNMYSLDHVECVVVLHIMQ